MDGVVNEAPVPIEAPPVEAEYQFIVPAEDVAPRVTVPASHLDPGVVPVIVGIGVTVMETSFDVAGLPVAHVISEVSIQLTKSPSSGERFVYVGKFSPISPPFSFHW